MILGEKKAKNVKRVSLFLLGVLMGSIFMYFMVFRDRDYIKTPEQIIKEQLQHRKFVVTPQGLCFMQCKNITDDEIKKLFITGTINYKKSVVHDKPCKKYALEGTTTQGEKVRVMCGLCDLETNIISVKNIQEEKDTCKCE